MFCLPFFGKASPVGISEPEIHISVTTSSPILSLSETDDNIEPFSITLEAFVTGTHNGQPITIYALDTLLHPETGSVGLEYKGLVFTDTSTNKPAERLVLDICPHYPENLDSVSPRNERNFVEIPCKDALGAEKPYTITYSFDNESGVSFLDPKLGFVSGRKHGISLGSHMSSVIWWRVGKKDRILEEGQRNGTHMSFMPSQCRLQMMLDSETTFGVVD